MAHTHTKQIYKVVTQFLLSHGTQMEKKRQNYT